MKNLNEYINESSVNENAYWNNINRTHESMFHNIREYAPVIYYTLLYSSDIKMVTFRYRHAHKDENIDWKNAIYKHANDDVLLDNEAIRALTEGSSKCKPEYKLMVKCAEAEWENDGGYWKQFEKSLKSIK